MTQPLANHKTDLNPDRSPDLGVTWESQYTGLLFWEQLHWSTSNL